MPDPAITSSCPDPRDMSACINHRVEIEVKADCIDAGNKPLLLCLALVFLLSVFGFFFLIEVIGDL